MSDVEGGDDAGADAETGGGGEVRADQLGVSYDGERAWGDDREDGSEAPAGRGRTFGDESDEDDAGAPMEGHGLADPLGGGDAGKTLSSAALHTSAEVVHDSTSPFMLCLCPLCSCVRPTRAMR